MKYTLETKEGVSLKTGKPYTLFIIHAETDDGNYTAHGTAQIDYNTKQAFDLLKVVDKK